MDSVLLSLHQDQRVRLWDPRDGRCLQVSAHRALAGCQVTCAEPLNKSRCRFVVMAGPTSNRVVLFDLWKMRVARTYEAGEARVLSLCRQSASVLLAVTSANELLRIDCSAFLDEQWHDYSRWKAEGQKNFEYAQWAVSSEQLRHLPPQLLVRTFYAEEVQALVALFKKELVLCFASGVTLVLQQSRNALTFTNVYLCECARAKLLVLSTRRGELTAVLWSDVQAMVQHLRTGRDFAYGYKEFAFQRVGAHAAQVQLNLHPLVAGANSLKALPPDLRRLAQNAWMNNSYTSSKVYQYCKAEGVLNVYSTEEGN